MHMSYREHFQLLLPWLPSTYIWMYKLWENSFRSPLKQLLCYSSCNVIKGRESCWHAGACRKEMGTPCLSGGWCQLLKSIVRNLPHFNKKTYEKKIQMWYMIMHWKSISQINRIVTRSMKKVVIWHNNEDNDNDEIWLIDYVFSWDQEMWSDT